MFNGYREGEREDQILIIPVQALSNSIHHQDSGAVLVLLSPNKNIFIVLNSFFFGKCLVSKIDTEVVSKFEVEQQ